VGWVLVILVLLLVLSQFQQFHSHFSQRSFAAAGPKLWNHPPSRLMTQTDINFAQFKLVLKTFFVEIVLRCDELLKYNFIFFLLTVKVSV